MKKILAVSFLSAIILFAASCAISNPLFKNFSELQTDYETIVAVAKHCYASQKQESSEHIILLISNGKLTDTEGNNIPLSAEQYSCLERISSDSYTDYDFLWVSNDYVIFWEDETKYYGLLFSDKPSDIIKSFKNDWFEGIEYNKINDEWYEIGVF